MKKGLWAGATFILFIGVITVALVIVTNSTEGTVITAHDINYFGQWTWHYYTFDVYKYLKSLETSINPMNMFMSLPNFPSLPQNPDWTNIVSILNYVAKILAVFIPNVAIYMINTFWVPTKLILYPATILMALIGFDTNWPPLMEGIRFMYTLQIPFIPYW